MPRGKVEVVLSWLRISKVKLPPKAQQAVLNVILGRGLSGGVGGGGDQLGAGIEGFGYGGVWLGVGAGFGDGIG